jgi:hypothetical protein
MRERNGFIEEMFREEALATGGIHHHNRGKLDANLRKKLDLRNFVKSSPQRILKLTYYVYCLLFQSSF